MEIKKFIYIKANKTPLKIQIALLITIIFSIIISSIILYMYSSNSSEIINKETSNMNTELKLESQNLDDFYMDIDKYSLLLRQDNRFLQIISSKKPLTYQDSSYIKSILASNFNSRAGLKEYKLYLVNNDTNFMINSTNKKVIAFESDSVMKLPLYSIFTAPPYYKSIQPSNNINTYMVYYRTIINIKNRTPLAIVQLTFDNSFMDSIAENYKESYGLLFVVNKDSNIFYSNDLSILNDITYKKNVLPYQGTPSKSFVVTIGGKKYLGAYLISDKSGSIIYNLKPINLINKNIIHARNISILIGLLAIILSAILSTYFIQLITKPLSTLSHRLRSAGAGNFTTAAQIGGSLEIYNLSNNFNNMILKIDDLIKTTYISELNEKTARLIALEAQLNPHFIYNTLQSISAEAIMNDQENINYMVTALALMLRYLIKGGDYVTLNQEISHVKNYLLLQKARFDDNLTYEICMDFPEQMGDNFFIPKISIQTLLENSLIHGMKVSIHIKIFCHLTEKGLTIIVEDNGCGISKERLDQLKKTFSTDISKNTNNNIGLLNLHSRLQILYNNRASLQIESIVDQRTTVTLFIPKEENFNV